MTKHYEWDIEIFESDSEDPEILDHDFTFRKPDNPTKDWRLEGASERLVLVLDDDGFRYWAYVVDGKLPELFEDAFQRPMTNQRVPKRFHDQIAKLYGEQKNESQ